MYVLQPSQPPILTVSASKLSNVDESVDQVEKVFSKLPGSGTSPPNAAEPKAEKDAGPSKPDLTYDTENSNHAENDASPKVDTQPEPSTVQRIPNVKKSSPKDSAVELSNHDLELETQAAGTPSPQEELEARREINRNLREMQPVVATLTLDEDWSDEEDTDNEGDDYPENEFGMHNFREYMSDEYVVQMNALSQKYDENRNETFIAADAKGKGPVIDQPQPAQSSLRTETKTKTAKGVRFAESLDVADEAEEKATADAESDAEQKPAPLAEIVQERSNAKPENTAMPMKPFQKMSKFKAARMAADVVAQRER